MGPRNIEGTDIERNLRLRQEMTLLELKEKVEAEEAKIARGEEGLVYYSLANIKPDKHSKVVIIASLKTPITSENLGKLLDEHSWGKDPDETIAVTNEPDMVGQEDVSELTLRDYADMFHYYLARYSKPSRMSSDLKNLKILVGRFLADYVGEKEIASLKISEDDLRPVQTYLDHMANTALILLVLLVVINRRRNKWTPNDPYDQKRPQTYALNEPVTHSGCDVRQVAVPDTVLNAFFGTLFHDAALIENHSPATVGPQCFAQKVPDELIMHGEKGLKFLGPQFDERYVTRNIIKGHHAAPEKAGKHPNLLLAIMRAADIYDELSSSEPILYRLARLRDKDHFSVEVVDTLLGIIEPFSDGESMTLYAGIGGKREAIGTCIVKEGKSRISPVVQITGISHETFATLKGRVITVNPFGKIPLYI